MLILEKKNKTYGFQPAVEIGEKHEEISLVLEITFRQFRLVFMSMFQAW